MIEFSPMGARIETGGRQFLERDNYKRARTFIGQYKVALSKSHFFKRALREIEPDLTPQSYFQPDKKSDSGFPVRFSTPSSSYEFLYVQGEEHEVLWIKKISKKGVNQTVMLFAGKPEYDGAEAVNEGQIALSLPVFDTAMPGKPRDKNPRRHDYYYNDLKSVVAAYNILNDFKLNLNAK